jgi:SAM-dependent methyltransferase
MYVTQMPGESNYVRLHGILDAFPQLRDGVVLDVGCRHLAATDLPGGRNLCYLGFDRDGEADVRGDLGQGLPFHSTSLDMVLALDVLEHVDDIHAAFAELCRVTRRYVAITLPNIYEIAVRWRFLRGQPLSKKYGLPTESPTDRHRWIFSLSDARQFCHGQAFRCGFGVVAECCLVGPRRRRLLGDGALVRWPDLFVPTYGVLMGRQQNVWAPAGGLSASGADPVADQRPDLAARKP